jgi:lipopolysaccharide transport system ATP-binding protein
MSELLIKIDQVGVRYRKRRSFFRHDFYQALNSISFSIHEGDTVGIVGRNGCGKSTILRLLAGIYHPDSGTITRCKGVIASLLTLQAGFDQELSGMDNALFSSMLLGLKKNEAKRCLDDIAEFSELGEFIYQPVKSYSTGMRARLGFAIALQVKPDILLIDEVLGVGDAHFRQKAEGAMKKAMSECRAIVMVSHSLPQIRRACKRVIWIDHGLIKADGETEEVLSIYDI